MNKDITSLFKIGDNVSIILKKPLYPVCLGSETHLRSRSEKNEPTEKIEGTYAGARPGLIKVNPDNKELLGVPEDISRYIVITEDQIKEAYRKGERVFP